jgi:hypothetical protein
MIGTQKLHIRPSLLDSLDRLEDTHTTEIRFIEAAERQFKL